MLRCGHGWSRLSPLFSVLSRRDFKFGFPFGAAGNSPLSGVVRRYVAAAASILDGGLPAAVAALPCIEEGLYLFCISCRYSLHVHGMSRPREVLRPSIPEDPSSAYGWFQNKNVQPQPDVFYSRNGMCDYCSASPS